MDLVFDHLHTLLILLAIGVALASCPWVLWLFGVILVPDDSIGIVTRKFVLLGSRSRLADGHILALQDEAGYQADTLAPERRIRSFSLQNSGCELV
jgi:hypothetical protein